MILHLHDPQFAPDLRNVFSVQLFQILQSDCSRTKSLKLRIQIFWAMAMADPVAMGLDKINTIWGATEQDERGMGMCNCQCVPATARAIIYLENNMCNTI